MLVKSFSQVIDEQIAEAVDWMNNYSRKILGILDRAGAREVLHQKYVYCLSIVVNTGYNKQSEIGKYFLQVSKAAAQVAAKYRHGTIARPALSAIVLPSNA